MQQRNITKQIKSTNKINELAGTLVTFAFLVLLVLLPTNRSTYINHKDVSASYPKEEFLYIPYLIYRIIFSDAFDIYKGFY